MRPVAVVLVSPVGDKDLGFERVPDYSMACVSSRMREA
jgi:hypothetical protein